MQHQGIMLKYRKRICFLALPLLTCGILASAINSCTTKGDLPPCEGHGTNFCIPKGQLCPEGSEHVDYMFECENPNEKCCTYWE